ncbi:AfsA-related hotdog domain-containing protein [Streptomyces sp. NPDC097619]|uniref:AfsA-related hotdog domain-containing protein n=1 Tax=Streptomyces sp. NPDC097619 TaxID=3157228 RepID=UPI003319D291
MSRSATAEELDLTAVTRRLVHLPRPPAEPGSGSGTAGERFVLAAGLPCGPSLFRDASGGHDTQLFTEIVRQLGLSLGHRYFGVPAERACLFVRMGWSVPDPAVWRAGAAGGRPRMSMDIGAVPTKVVGGVPRGLRLTGALDIDGAPGCAGSAELVFLPPAVARTHRATSRLAAVSAGGPRPDGAGAVRPSAAPGAVGRAEAADVVVSVPEGRGEVTTTAIVVDPGHPVFFLDGTDSVPGLLLVEAVRQTALLAAGRRHGFAPAETALTGLAVHFRGFAELDLPLSCTAVTGPVGRDGAGRPCATVRLTVSQLGKVTAEAEITAARAA